MNLNEWLDKQPGRVVAMAARFGVSHSAVSQWRKNGVPLRHMPAVSDFTGGDVSLSELAQAGATAALERAAT